jgi:hypothetical protein
MSGNWDLPQGHAAKQETGGTMTPERINSVIAEWHGRKHQPSVTNEEGYQYCGVNDYYHDLNAIHEAVRKLNRLEREGFMWQLGIIVHDEEWNYLNATAAQRCEALLRTIGKWEEGK